MRWCIAVLLLLSARYTAAQTPPAPTSADPLTPTFSSTIDVVATPADVAKGQTLAPGVRSRNDSGFRIESFNPRFEAGGPVIKDRVFLEQTGQARFAIGDLASRPETDQRVIKAVSTFTRVDANISRRHFLVATVGMFPSFTEFATVGTFTPPEASVNFHI